MGKVTDPSILSALEGGRVEDPAILAVLEGKKPPKTSIVQRAKDIINAGVKASSAESEMMSGPDILPAIGTIVSGGTSWIPAGIVEAGGVLAGEGKNLQKLAEMTGHESPTQAMQAQMTPKLTEQGEAIVKPFSAPFEYISKKSAQAADWTFKKTGSPILATAVRVAGESIPFTAPMGVKGAKGMVREVLRDIGKKVQEKAAIVKTEDIKIEDAPLPKEEPPVAVEPIQETPPTVEPILTEEMQPRVTEEQIAPEIPLREPPVEPVVAETSKPEEAPAETPPYKQPVQHYSEFKNGEWTWPEDNRVPLYHETNADINSIIQNGIQDKGNGVYALQAPQTTPESFKRGVGQRYTIEFDADFSGEKQPIYQSEGKYPRTAYENPEWNTQGFTESNYKGVWRGYDTIPKEAISLIYDNKEGRVIYRKPATASPLTDVPLEAKEASGEGVVSGNVHDESMFMDNEQKKSVNKEPWQLTKEEFVGAVKDVDAIAIRKTAHAQHVRNAVAEGKPVPDNVLQAYSNNEWAKKQLNPQPSAKPTQIPIPERHIEAAYRAKARIQEGEPGRRIPLEDGTWTGIPSTYPDFFKGKGYKAKDVIHIIDKATAGKPLTELQRVVFDDIISGERAEVAAEIWEHRRYEREQREAERDFREDAGWSESESEGFSDSLVQSGLRDGEANSAKEGILGEEPPADKFPWELTPEEQAKFYPEFTPESASIKPEPTVSESPKSEPQTDLQSTGEPQKAKVSNEAPSPETVGETKESTLAKRTEADAIEHTLTEGFGDLSSYKTMSMKEQAESAQALMDTDFDLAQRIAMGQEEPPAGLRAASVYEAVKIRARDAGDVETLRRLATESTIPTKLSELGQEIKAADSRQMEDPVVAMQEVVKAREAVTEKTTGRKPKVHEAEVQALKDKLDEVQKKLDEHLAKSAGDAIDSLVGKAKPKAERAPLRYGSKNKIVSKADYEATKRALNERLNTQFNAGIDPVNIADMGKIGLYHLEAGMREFGAWSKRMVADLGDIVKPHLKDLWDSTKEAFSKATTDNLIGKISKASEEGADLAEMGRFVQELAEHFVASGIKEREPLITAVHEVLKDIIPDLTRRDTMDAISGYGKFTPLSKDEIKTQLRDLKGQMQQVGKLEDLQNRQPPLKTGVERRTPSDEERRLIKLVEEAKKKYGIQVVDKETQLKSALDAIKTRLKNQISDLETQIASRTKLVKEKSSVARDAEAARLTAKRDALKAQYDEIFGKTKMTDEQKIRMATASIEKSIAEYERRIKEKDMSIRERGAPITSPALKALRERRDKLKGEYQHLKDLANPKKTPEQIALQSLKTRLKNEATKLEGKMKALDFTKKPRREIPLDPEAKRLKAERDRVKEAYQAASDVGATITPEEAARIVELSKAVADAKRGIERGEDPHLYGAAKVEFDNYVEGLKGSGASIQELLKRRAEQFKTEWKEHEVQAAGNLAKDTAQQIADNSIAASASIDNSIIGRQGATAAFTHPIVQWWPGIKQSFRNIVMEMGGKRAMDALWADVYSRENYRNGSYDKAGILSKNEEQFPTSMPGRLPYAGRLFKASEAAFEGGALRMRVELFDYLVRKSKENGVDVLNGEWLEDMGKVVSSATARAQVGRAGQHPMIRVILWAPKMLKASWDVLTAHTFTYGLKAREAKIEAAKNCAKIWGSMSAIIAVANSINPGSAETNPLSTDFGTIRWGDTKFDFTGGKRTLITFIARQIVGASKSAATGITTPYGAGFGKKDRLDELGRFIINKAPPVTRSVWEAMQGEDFQGRKPTVAGTVYKAYTPISIQNFVQLHDTYTEDRMAGAIVDVVGISANSYAPSEADWTFNTTKELQQFMDKVGEDKFKEANDKFNQGYNEWFAKIADSAEFQKLSDEDKKTLLTQKKEELKKSIQVEYSFHSRNTEHRRSSAEKTAKRRLLRGDID